MSVDYERTPADRAAVEAAPAVLAELSTALGVSLAPLGAPVRTALTELSYLERASVTAAVSDSAPMFARIAEDFFPLLENTVAVALQVGTREYSVVVKALHLKPCASLDQQAALAGALLTRMDECKKEDERQARRIKTTNILKTGLVVVTTACEIIQTADALRSGGSAAKKALRLFSRKRRRP